MKMKLQLSNLKLSNEVFLLFLIFAVLINFSQNCQLKRQEFLRPIMTRIQESDIQQYNSEADFKEIRIHVDWTHFNDNIPETNKDFAKAIKSTIFPRTVNIFQKLVRVRRLIKPLKFPDVKDCDRYKVPKYLRTKGVNADIVLFPIIEPTGEFLQQRVEAAALYCSQSTLDGRPLLGFIEYRPNLLVGAEHHIDYHIWLSIHELTHVFVFNDSLFGDFVDPKTLKKLGKDNVMKGFNINGMNMNFVVTKKIKELAAEHYNCPDAKGLPLENKGSAGSRDGHWNRKALNGEVMLSKSFGENLISKFTLALFEDSGWYKVNYELANHFAWGKGKGCDFLYCKDCFSEKLIDSEKKIYKVRSKYPAEFCSNFNNPVCSTHNIFRGNCVVSEKNNSIPKQIKVTPFTEKSFGGLDETLDYCPTAVEEKYGQKYYGGSCRVGSNDGLASYEKICPNCACVITDINPKKSDVLAKNRKLRVKFGNAKFGIQRKIFFQKSKYLKASCMEYHCKKGELYLSTLDQNFLCDKRYLQIPNLGVVKCPAKSVICHPKYKCKFGCVEKYHEADKKKKIR